MKILGRLLAISLLLLVGLGSVTFTVVFVAALEGIGVLTFLGLLFWWATKSPQPPTPVRPWEQQ
jgi:hypothetical protein